MTDASPRVVVVGSGIAGLTAALHADRAGCEVTIITKDVLDHTNTRYAQGGIAGVVFADDRVSDHVRDTLVAGAGHADADAVEVLASEGAERIHELIEAGVAFDRDAAGELVRGLEAAHSFPRILHAGGDATGLAIQLALHQAVRARSITIREHAFLLDLVVHDDRVHGVEILLAPDPAARGRRRILDADAVVLATGGAGQLYAHTTNPRVATGDGLAAAMRAGAEVEDLEFVQFHPTVMPRVDGPGSASHEAFLISEAVRGEGAVLRDAHGRRFLSGVHPDAELAPRDVVARAIAAQMAEQGGRPVFLDATGLPRGGGATTEQTRAFLARRFPTIDHAMQVRGLDWAREPVPVTPAAHYLMGGVTTDLRGRTSIAGLYAVGEVARTGVHGANRLASNSLLEGAVFGARAGDAIAADSASLRSTPAWRWPRTRYRDVVTPAAAPSLTASPPTPFRRAALQELMWTHAGVVRTGDGLRRAATQLSAWAGASPDEVDTIGAAEDANLLLVATEVVRAAQARRQSVGAHFRSDGEPLAASSSPDSLVSSRAQKVPA